MVKLLLIKFSSCDATAFKEKINLSSSSSNAITVASPIRAKASLASCNN